MKGAAAEMDNAEERMTTSDPEPRIVTACVLIIGNEILSGRTQDANLAFLAQVGVGSEFDRAAPSLNPDQPLLRRPDSGNLWPLLR